MWSYENGFLANIDQSGKKKGESERQRSTQLAKLSPEWGGSEIIKLYCQSEEGWRVGVTLQSERCTVAEHSRGERRVWSHLEAYRGIRGGLLTASEVCPLHFLCFLKICANEVFYFWCDTFSCACLIWSWLFSFIFYNIIWQPMKSKRDGILLLLQVLLQLLLLKALPSLQRTQLEIKESLML